MRQVNRSLNKLFKFGIPDFIHNEGKNDWCRERQQVQPTDDQCVLQHVIEFCILEQSLEMFKTYPWTFQNPQMWIVILEGHQKTSQRHVRKHE